MSGRGSGRGKLLQELRNLTLTEDSGIANTREVSQSVSTPDSDDEILPIARGRGNRMMRNMAASESGVSETSSVLSSSIQESIPIGRGRLFAMAVKSMATKPMLEDSDDELEVKQVEREVEKQVEVVEEKEPESLTYRGEKGTYTRVAVNYIRLKCNPDKGVFEYEVRFDPPVVTKGLRYNLLGQMKDITGPAKTFDGVILYLPIKLPEVKTVATKQDREGNSYQVTIIYKKQKTLRECIHLYNVLFDRVMKTLKYVRYNRKQFDPSKPMMVPQHRLEIWPGYVTAVDEYENGLMLCIDVSFRILNTRTVLDVMREAMGGSRDHKDSIQKALTGATILTRYNNKTYRIDDFLWDMSPASTFEKSDSSQISFAEYYKQTYNLDIQDTKQPLLLHIETKRISGKTEPVEQRLCFIPELCYLTGLTDTMRSDFKIMKDVATHTRITPNQRANSLRTFLQSIEECAEAKALFTQWGLIIDRDILRLEARQLPYEEIIFRNKTVNAGPQADFNRDLCNNEVITPIDFKKWLLIYTKRDSNTAKKFSDLACRNARPMGIIVNQPVTVELTSDSIDSYVSAIRKNIANNYQIVVTICPTARDDRYAAIKKVCYSESPIASQVINSRTLANDQKARGIVQKILLQMTAKLGGELWSIRIPFKNVMIIGIDSYHETSNRGNSVGGY